MRRILVAMAIAGGSLFVGSCLRDAFAPGAGFGARLGIAPTFESGNAPLVDFDRVRVTIVRAVTGRRVVDTLVPFPADADSVELGVEVILETPEEEFLVFVRMITVTGDTVFRNDPYPQRVVAVAGGASPILETLLRYVGVGANAVAVVIATPDSLVTFDDTLALSAVALGADQLPIPGTPIAWSTLDALRVTVPDQTIARVVGESQRGPARIVARLLTGPADTITVTAQPPATLLEIVSGNGQQGTPGTALALPVRVRVTAADGLGVLVPVRFQALTPGAVVADTLVPSDSAGYAETSITLASTVGTQAFEVSVAGLTAPISAVGVTNVASVTVTSTATTLDALGLTAQFSAVALDNSGGTLAVPIKWSSSDESVVTVDSATGVATALGNGIANVIATAEGVQGSAPLNVAQVVTQLAFLSQPTDALAGVAIDTVSVKALDASGFVATNYTGGVAVARGDATPCPATLLGTTPRSAVAGIATFDDLSFQQACPGLQLVATSGSFSTPLSSVFVISAGPAAVLSVVSGNGQTGTVGTTLPQLLDVQVADQYGNPVSGEPVSWVPGLGSGQLTATATTTDASGRATATWSLGIFAGIQSAQAQVGTGLAANFTATALAGAAAKLVFLVPPSDAVALQIIAPPVEVAAADQYGNRVPWTTPVDIVIRNNPVGAVLNGLVQVVPVQDVATFTDLSISLPGVGFTLEASSGGLIAESKPFNITTLPAGPVFAGDSAGLAHSGVFRAAADGSGYTRLNDQGYQGDVHPRWGPDRTRVAFTSDDRGQGTNALFIVNDAATEIATLVSDTSTRRARWNRDASHIAFECGPKIAQNDVCVVRDVNGSVGGLDRRGEGTGKIFVTDFDDRQDGPAAFAWDPQDPNVLVVVRDQLDLKQEMASTIYFVTADFQPLVLLQLGPLVDPQTQQTLRIVGTLDISPDGEFIVFAAEDASATGRWLYVIDRRGEALMPLTTGPTYDSHPVISPDGREVLFLRQDPSKCMTDYWRVDIASGTETQVSLEQWCDFNPASLGYDWSPDGKDIVLVGSEFIGDPTNLLIYGIPSGITAVEYETQRRLIGRAPDPGATVQDLQPSWRP